MGDILKVVYEDREDWADFQKEYEIVGLQSWPLYSDREKFARILVEAFPELEGKIIVHIVSVLASYDEEKRLERENRENDLEEWKQYKKLKKKWAKKQPPKKYKHSKKSFDESDDA